MSDPSDTWGWKARVLPDGFMRNGARLAVYRNHSDGVLELLDRAGVVHRIASNEAPPEPFDHIEVPRPALAAIREAIDVEMGMRVDEALVRQLRDDLTVERARVDTVIAAQTRPEAPRV